MRERIVGTDFSVRHVACKMDVMMLERTYCSFHLMLCTGGKSSPSSKGALDCLIVNLINIQHLQAV